MSHARRLKRQAKKGERAYATGFSLKGTVTGRTSSTMPNLQNAPRRPPEPESLYDWLWCQRVYSGLPGGHPNDLSKEPLVRVMLHVLLNQRGWTALARLEFKRWLKDDALAYDTAVEALLRMTEPPSDGLFTCVHPVIEYLRVNYPVPLSHTEAQYLLEMES